MRLGYKEAIKLLNDHQFYETHRKGSHIKFKKGTQVVMITEGGYRGTNQLHAKQQRELLNAINGIETNQTIMQHGK